MIIPWRPGKSVIFSAALCIHIRIAVGCLIRRSFIAEMDQSMEFKRRGRDPESKWIIFLQR